MNEEAVQSVRARSRIFDVVLKAIPDAAVVTDDSGRILQANNAAATLLEYSVDELQALQIEDVLQDPHQKLIRAHRESLVASMGTRAHANLRDVTAHTNAGRAMSLAVQLTLVHLEGEHFVVTTLRNLTREYELEQLVSDYEGQLHAINMLSSDWYWRQDANMRFTYISPRGRHIQLRDSNDAIGMSGFESPYEYESEQHKEEHEQNVVARKPFRNLLIHNPENDTFALVTGEPLFDKAGKFCGYHGVATDVTEEKRAFAPLPPCHPTGFGSRTKTFATPTFRPPDKPKNLCHLTVSWDAPVLNWTWFGSLKPQNNSMRKRSKRACLSVTCCFAPNQETSI